jgi:cystathionine beta-lyase/cystathionine gamma-synthase
MTHASIPAETRRALGLSDTLVRLSPGCESARDLVQDLIEGLDRLGTAKTETTDNLQLTTKN